MRRVNNTTLLGLGLAAGVGLVLLIQRLHTRACERRVDEKRDETLEASFPASDPPAF